MTKTQRVRIALIDEVSVRGRGVCLGTRAEPFEVETDPEEAERLIAEGYAIPCGAPKPKRETRRRRDQFDFRQSRHSAHDTDDD